MTPSGGASNELKRLLLASRQEAVEHWFAGLCLKPEVRKKLSGTPSDEHLANLASIYDSLVDPLTVPTKTGKTRKPRLKEAQKKYLEFFSLHEVQQIQLLLLDVLTEAVRKKFAAKPKKIDRLSARLADRMHDLVIQTGRADAERREAAAAREESKYARLLDMASDAIFMPDYKTGLFVEVNEAACKLTGYSERELKQMGFNSLFSVFDLNLAIEKTNTALEEGAVRFDDLSIYTKKGAEVPVDISVSVGKIDGRRHVIAIVRDIK